MFWEREAATGGTLQEKVFPQACNFIKKETMAQVFSCEFCEISKNNFFTEHLWATASEEIQLHNIKLLRL